MNTINNIIIFDDDQHFIGLLRGYCYTKRIKVTEINLNIEAISVIEEIKPELVFLSIDTLNFDKKIMENIYSCLISACNSVIICGVNKKPTDNHYDIPKWIDPIINNPLDISEIDLFIKSKFLLNIFAEGDRRHTERRCFKERRSDLFNHKSQSYNENDYKAIAFNNFRIDFRNKCAYLANKKVDLTRKEYDLLEFISADMNKIYSAEEIINHIWPDNNRATKSDLYQYMHLLRKKIEEDPNNPKLIINMKGFGYKLNADEVYKINNEPCYA